MTYVDCSFAPRTIYSAVLLLGGLVLVACANYSPKYLAAQNNWSLHYQTQTMFEHLIIHNDAAGRYLHVYIEGDGRSFVSPRRVSLDPTPTKSLMLELMTLDSEPALFLGRPCYFGTNDRLCRPQWWVEKRYAKEVVDSMNAVLDHAADTYQGVMLFGHSGGATLAMLMAARRDDVIAIVTLAGNLDIQAWTSHHGYTALTGSLNPIDDDPLASTTLQLHYLGEQDEKITSAMLQPAIARQQNVNLTLVPDIDHGCCWRRLWPGILIQLSP